MFFLSLSSFLTQYTNWWVSSGSPISSFQYLSPKFPSLISYAIGWSGCCEYLFLLSLSSYLIHFTNGWLSSQSFIYSLSFLSASLTSGWNGCCKCLSFLAFPSPPTTEMNEFLLRLLSALFSSLSFYFRPQPQHESLSSNECFCAFLSCLQMSFLSFPSSSPTTLMDEFLLHILFVLLPFPASQLPPPPTTRLAGVNWVRLCYRHLFLTQLLSRPLLPHLLY